MSTIWHNSKIHLSERDAATSESSGFAQIGQWIANRLTERFQTTLRTPSDGVCLLHHALTDVFANFAIYAVVQQRMITFEVYQLNFQKTFYCTLLVSMLSFLVVLDLGDQRRHALCLGFV